MTDGSSAANLSSKNSSGNHSSDTDIDIDKHLNPSNPRVLINCAGSRSEISLALLQAHPQTLLGEWSATQSTRRRRACMADGVQLYMDRDPESFRVILNWYRYGILVIPNAVPYELVAADIAHFKLPIILHQQPPHASTSTQMHTHTHSSLVSPIVHPLYMNASAHPFISPTPSTLIASHHQPSPSKPVAAGSESSSSSSSTQSMLSLSHTLSHQPLQRELSNATNSNQANAANLSMPLGKSTSMVSAPSIPVLHPIMSTAHTTFPTAAVASYSPLNSQDLNTSPARASVPIVGMTSGVRMDSHHRSSSIAPTATPAAATATQPLINFQPLPTLRAQHQHGIANDHGAPRVHARAQPLQSPAAAFTSTSNNGASPPHDQPTSTAATAAMPYDGYISSSAHIVSPGPPSSHLESSHPSITPPSLSSSSSSRPRVPFDLMIESLSCFRDLSRQQAISWLQQEAAKDKEEGGEGSYLFRYCTHDTESETSVAGHTMSKDLFVLTYLHHAKVYHAKVWRLYIGESNSIGAATLRGYVITDNKQPTNKDQTHTSILTLTHAIIGTKARAIAMSPF